MRKKKVNKNLVYEVEYASGLLRNNGRQNQLIISNKELNDGDFIIVEHIDCGIFVGRVKGTTLGSADNELLDRFDLENCEYEYIQHVDVSKWWNEIQRKERIKELQQEMEEKFSEIDKKKKFEYYAQIDDDFRDLYLEYEDLNKKEVK